jgi:hypothetical protein
VGAGTHPGNGVATVLISARHTTDRVFQDAGIPRPAFGLTPAATQQNHMADTSQQMRRVY